MRKRSIMAVFMILLLFGCAVQRIPFPETEYAGLELSGDKTLTGTIFLIDQLEEKQVGAGSVVTLEPITSYSNHWYEMSYQRNKAIEEADPRYEKYIRKTTADPEGRFTFTDVGPGEYFLHGPVYWEATTCSANVVKTKVMICKKISVGADDAVVDIDLTKEYKSPTLTCDLYTQGAWEKGWGN